MRDMEVKVNLPALRASRERLIGFTANAVSAQLSFLCCCLKKLLYIIRFTTLISPYSMTSFLISSVEP
jgi:hypothetical protein